jgi:hypothetical protein
LPTLDSRFQKLTGRWPTNEGLVILRHMNIHQLFARAVQHEQAAEWLEAARLYEECLRIEPRSPDVHFSLALCLLRVGDYERGWREYQWGFERSIAPQIHFDVPQWDGRQLNGETIFLYDWQGIGDILQMVRYLPLVRARGARLLLACRSRLVKLLLDSGVADEFTSGDSPPFQFHAPLVSLPIVFGEPIPASIPYLKADAELVEKWREILPNGFKVGICWQGSKTYQHDSHRSFPLSEFAPLAEVPGVRLVSLQNGHGAEQLTHAPFEVIDLGEDLDKDNALTDTAAVMQSLDLIVSADTATAHLAGALGRPVWIPLPVVHDWRWLADNRSDTPWYPTMRLFRQRTPGQWAPVFERMAAELVSVFQQRQ